MTIKNESQLKAPLTSPAFRSVTAEDILDIVDSKFDIGGQMDAQFQTFSPAGGDTWESFAVFTESTEKGLIPDLPNASYTLEAVGPAGEGANGNYALDVNAIVQVGTNATVAIAIALNGVRVYESPSMTMQPNDPKAIPLMGLQPLVAGDVLTVQFRSSVSSNVSADQVQFRVTRQ